MEQAEPRSAGHLLQGVADDAPLVLLPARLPGVLEEAGWLDREDLAAHLAGSLGAAGLAAPLPTRAKVQLPVVGLVEVGTSPPAGQLARIGERPEHGDRPRRDLHGRVHRPRLHVGHSGHRSPPSRCRFRLWRFSAQKAR